MQSKLPANSPAVTFFVYPAEPPIVAETIDSTLAKLGTVPGHSIFRPWTETNIAGHFIGTEVLNEIANASRVVADVSVLNFNVTYEIGYTIGRKKPLILLRNRAIASSATEPLPPPALGFMNWVYSIRSGTSRTRTPPTWSRSCVPHRSTRLLSLPALR